MWPALMEGLILATLISGVFWWLGEAREEQRQTETQRLEDDRAR